jgi:DNA-binding transcriptional MerR regulator
MEMKDLMTHSQAYLFLGIPSHRLRYIESKGKIKPVISPFDGHRLYKKVDLEALKIELDKDKKVF